MILQASLLSNCGGGAWVWTRCAGASPPLLACSFPSYSRSTRGILERACRGKTIASISAIESGGGPRTGQFDEIVFEKLVGPEPVEKALLGRQVTGVKRKGKTFWLELGPAAAAAAAAAAGGGAAAGEASPFTAAVMHLGMTGSVTALLPSGEAEQVNYRRFKVDASYQWPPKFCKLQWQMSDGTKLAFTDPRRLARIRLVKDVLKEPPVSELGPDALLELPPLATLQTQLARRTLPIKAWLLDQNNLAGIGNWVADEVMYQAAIHPGSATNALSLEDVERLHSAIQEVLQTSVQVLADKKELPEHWLFHARWDKGKSTGKGKSKKGESESAGAGAGGGDMNKDSKGRAITHITVGGRTSAVVAAVQGSKPKSAPAAHVAAGFAKGLAVGLAAGAAAAAATAAAAGAEGAGAAGEEEDTVAVGASKGKAKTARGRGKSKATKGGAGGPVEEKEEEEKEGKAVAMGAAADTMTLSGKKRGRKAAVSAVADASVADATEAVAEEGKEKEEGEVLPVKGKGKVARKGIGKAGGAATLDASAAAGDAAGKKKTRRT